MNQVESCSTWRRKENFQTIALRSKALVFVPEMGVHVEIKNQSLHVLFKNRQISQKFYALTKAKKIPNADIDHLIKKMQQR